MSHIKHYSELKKNVIDAGHAWFDNGNYNLNIVGVRTLDVTANSFNDYIYIAFKTGGNEHIFCFDATTDPGLFWRENPINIDGAAIVKSGQYRGLWKIGKHQGKYPALIQRKPVTVYRDNNSDHKLDFDGEQQTGHFGINLHHASGTGTSKQVDKWSAGCQVLANVHDHELFMAICNKAASLYSNSFTYTLLGEK